MLEQSNIIEKIEEQNKGRGRGRGRGRGGNKVGVNI